VKIVKSESAVAIKKRIDDAHANQTLEEIQPHGGLARWLPDGLSSLTNLDEKLPISRNAVQDLARLFPQREPFLSGVHLPSAAKLTPLDQTEDSRRVLGQICPECLAALEGWVKSQKDLDSAKQQPLSLSLDYLRNMGAVSQRRSIEAAYRLAEVWRTCLKSE
jgi:hypothetical protein